MGSQGGDGKFDGGRKSGWGGWPSSICGSWDGDGKFKKEKEVVFGEKMPPEAAQQGNSLL